MKTLFTAAAAAALTAGAALAQYTEITFADLDVNEDGKLSLAELRAVAPDVTEDDFAHHDADGDGYFQEPEFETWLATYVETENPDPDGDEPIQTPA